MHAELVTPEELIRFELQRQADIEAGLACG
jgi:hypothetical protein